MTEIKTILVHQDVLTQLPAKDKDASDKLAKARERSPGITDDEVFLQHVQQAFTASEHGANPKPLRGKPYARVKYNQKERLYFFVQEHQGEQVGVVFFYDPEHDYEKYAHKATNAQRKLSAQLAADHTQGFSTIKLTDGPVVLQRQRKGTLGGAQLLVMDKQQRRLYQQADASPQSIVFYDGPGGVGKTLLALAKLNKRLKRPLGASRQLKQLYVTKSPELVAKSRELFVEFYGEHAAAYVDFLSHAELIQRAQQARGKHGAVADEEDFSKWWQAQKVHKGIDPRLIYDEMRHFAGNYLRNKQKYLAAPVHQCCFKSKAQWQAEGLDQAQTSKKLTREDVIHYYKNYTHDLAAQTAPKYPAEHLGLNHNMYDCIEVDEAALFNTFEAGQLNKAAKQSVAYYGDTHQGPNTFAAKQLSGGSAEVAVDVQHLFVNHRATHAVELAARVIMRMLDIYVGNPHGAVAETQVAEDVGPGRVTWHVIRKSTDVTSMQANSLAALHKVARDATYTIIVRDQETRTKLLAAQVQGTVLTLDEIQGREYGKVVLYQLLDSEYDEIAQTIRASKQSLEQDARGSKSADRAALFERQPGLKRLRDINLAASRAMDELHVINDRNSLLKLWQEGYEKIKEKKQVVSPTSADDATSVQSKVTSKVEVLQSIINNAGIKSEAVVKQLIRQLCECMPGISAEQAQQLIVEFAQDSELFNGEDISTALLSLPAEDVLAGAKFLRALNTDVATVDFVNCPTSLKLDTVINDQSLLQHALAANNFSFAGKHAWRLNTDDVNPLFSAPDAKTVIALLSSLQPKPNKALYHELFKHYATDTSDAALMRIRGLLQYMLAQETMPVRSIQQGMQQLAKQHGDGAYTPEKYLAREEDVKLAVAMAHCFPDPGTMAMLLARSDLLESIDVAGKSIFNMIKQRIAHATRELKAMRQKQATILALQLIFKNLTRDDFLKKNQKLIDFIKWLDIADSSVEVLLADRQQQAFSLEIRHILGLLRQDDAATKSDITSVKPASIELPFITAEGEAYIIAILTKFNPTVARIVRREGLLSHALVEMAEEKPFDFTCFAYELLATNPEDRVSTLLLTKRSSNESLVQVAFAAINNDLNLLAQVMDFFIVRLHRCTLPRKHYAACNLIRRFGAMIGRCWDAFPDRIPALLTALGSDEQTYSGGLVYDIFTSEKLLPCIADSYDTFMSAFSIACRSGFTHQMCVGLMAARNKPQSVIKQFSLLPGDAFSRFLINCMEDQRFQDVITKFCIWLEEQEQSKFFIEQELRNPTCFDAILTHCVNNLANPLYVEYQVLMIILKRTNLNQDGAWLTRYHERFGDEGLRKLCQSVQEYESQALVRALADAVKYAGECVNMYVVKKFPDIALLVLSVKVHDAAQTDPLTPAAQDLTIINAAARQVIDKDISTLEGVHLLVRGIKGEDFISIYGKVARDRRCRLSTLKALRTNEQSQRDVDIEVKKAICLRHEESPLIKLIDEVKAIINVPHVEEIADELICFLTSDYQGTSYLDMFLINQPERLEDLLNQLQPSSAFAEKFITQIVARQHFYALVMRREGLFYQMLLRFCDLNFAQQVADIYCPTQQQDGYSGVMLFNKLGHHCVMRFFQTCMDREELWPILQAIETNASKAKDFICFVWLACAHPPAFLNVLNRCKKSPVNDGKDYVLSMIHNEFYFAGQHPWVAELYQENRWYLFELCELIVTDQDKVISASFIQSMKYRDEEGNRFINIWIQDPEQYQPLFAAFKGYAEFFECILDQLLLEPNCGQRPLIHTLAQDKPEAFIAFCDGFLRPLKFDQVMQFFSSLNQPTSPVESMVQAGEEVFLHCVCVLLNRTPYPQHVRDFLGEQHNEQIKAWVEGLGLEALEKDNPERALTVRWLQAYVGVSVEVFPKARSTCNNPGELPDATFPKVGVVNPDPKDEPDQKGTFRRAFSLGSDD